MQIQKEERLKAKCRLIHENEFIFKRDKLFKDFRYIIIASLDKVNDTGDDWEGQINQLKTYMDSKFTESHERFANVYKGIANQEKMVVNIIKNQDHRMIEMKSKKYTI